MQQTWQFNNNILYGEFTKDGSTKIAAAAVLYSLDSTDNETQSDYTTTDRNGYWEFDISETGYYTVKFFGANADTTDFIHKIYLEYEQQEVDVAILNYSENPTMSIIELESKIDVNRGEVTKLSFVFYNIAPTSGRLSSIEIYYRRTEDGGDYQPFKTIPIVDITLNTITLKVPLELYAKPDYYDFQAIFLNTISIPYKVDDSIYIEEELNFKVDGVPDVYEYIEGIDLEAINTQDSEQGVITDDTIKLKWGDLKSLEETAFPIQSNDAFGREYEITYEVAQRLESYIIFMYVTSENVEPTLKHPGIAAIYGGIPYGGTTYGFKGILDGTLETGKWIFGGEFATPSCELTVPKGYYVGFWVGFKTQKTQSNIELESLVY